MFLDWLIRTSESKKLFLHSLIRNRNSETESIISNQMFLCQSLYKSSRITTTDSRPSLDLEKWYAHKWEDSKVFTKGLWARSQGKSPLNKHLQCHIAIRSPPPDIKIRPFFEFESIVFFSNVYYITTKSASLVCFSCEIGLENPYLDGSPKSARNSMESKLNPFSSKSLF